MDQRLRRELDLPLKRWAGQVIKRPSGKVDVALPWAGKWIEVEKVELPADLIGLSGLWRAQLWPGGVEFVGSEWEVVTWIARKCA